MFKKECKIYNWEMLTRKDSPSNIGEVSTERISAALGGSSIALFCSSDDPKQQQKDAYPRSLHWTQ